jgi:hypothetical protein
MTLSFNAQRLSLPNLEPRTWNFEPDLLFLLSVSLCATLLLLFLKELFRQDAHIIGVMKATFIKMHATKPLCLLSKSDRIVRKLFI